MFLFCASRIPSTRIPLSPGFARFTRTIPFENPSLSGICSLRSHIPPRLRRGDARCEIKKCHMEGFGHFVPTSLSTCRGALAMLKA